MPIVHGYGMTECPMICNGSPSDTDDQLANTEGAPIEGCAVSIVNPDTGELAGPGAEGEVRVAGPMLFKGYTDPSLEAGAFDEQGRFRTGDLGVMHDDGHVTLTGRLKDIIIRKGKTSLQRRSRTCCTSCLRSETPPSSDFRIPTVASESAQWSRPLPTNPI